MEALNVYAALSGIWGDDYVWAQARIFYSTGQKEAAFQCIMLMTLRLSQQTFSLDNLQKKLETNEIVKSEEKNAYVEKHGKTPDQEWLAYYRFCDQCARVACLELPIATLELSAQESRESFDKHWNQSFADFMTFVEEEYESLKKRTQQRI